MFLRPSQANDALHNQPCSNLPHGFVIFDVITQLRRRSWLTVANIMVAFDFTEIQLRGRASTFQSRYSCTFPSSRWYQLCWYSLRWTERTWAHSDLCAKFKAVKFCPHILLILFSPSEPSLFTCFIAIHSFVSRYDHVPSLLAASVAMISFPGDLSVCSVILKGFLMFSYEVSAAVSEHGVSLEELSF